MKISWWSDDNWGLDFWLRFFATHLCHSGWHLGLGHTRILGWCQIVLRWSELPITTSARIYASSNSIPFAPTFFLLHCWLSFDLAIWDSFPKILRETRLDEDKVILNRSCYAFRFSFAPLDEAAPRLLACIQFMTFAVNISGSIRSNRRRALKEAKYLWT